MCDNIIQERRETGAEKMASNVMSNEEMSNTPHFLLDNGWVVVKSTGHTWKFNGQRNRWENWQ
jgi:hypothetical protein